MKSLEGRRILVTGADGFIGSHLVEALVRAQADVRAMVLYDPFERWGLIDWLPMSVRRTIEVVKGDVRSFSTVQQAVRGCQIVFHLAALISIPYSYVAPDAYIETNIRGTWHVLQACLEEGVERVIHTSTSEVYGTAQYVPMDETHPLRAQSPYAATKIAADKLAESYYYSFNLPVVILRPFNTFGPRQSARAVIPTIITQALHSNIIKLGNLTPVRDFTFVDDVVAAFIRAAICDGVVGEVINIGTGSGVSVREIVDYVAQIVGRELHVQSIQERSRPATSEVERLICDAQKAQRLLGWLPRCKFVDGLKVTVQWIAEHIEFYKPHIYAI